MMPNITWKQEAKVAGGPSFSATQSVAVEAYDKVRVDLPDVAGPAPEVTVEIGAATGDVEFLLISSSLYGGDLTFKVNATGNPAHQLDRPLLLAGAGALGLLGFPPTSLLFTNDLGAAATVEILVGRDATPPGP